MLNIEEYRKILSKLPAKQASAYEDNLNNMLSMIREDMQDELGGMQIFND